MSKREKVILVVLVAIGVVTIGCKGELRRIGLLFLGIGMLISILGIMNIFMTNQLFKCLIQNMIIIKYMKQQKNKEHVLSSDKAQLEIVESLYDYSISEAQKDARECIEKLKQNKGYLSEDRYKSVLAIEKDLANNEIRETGRL